MSDDYQVKSLRSTQKARDDGWFGNGQVMKIWNTASDAAVCDYCRWMHGVSCPLDEEFPGIEQQSPPAHGGCRCTLTYEVIDKKDTSAYGLITRKPPSIGVESGFRNLWSVAAQLTPRDAASMMQAAPVAYNRTAVPRGCQRLAEKKCDGVATTAAAPDRSNDDGPS